MAPEIAADGKCTGKEDLYSLGITMYALLMAGRVPFDFSGRECKRRERSDKIESLFIHPELLRIIQRATAFEACDRYSGLDGFSKDIQSFMDVYGTKLDEEMPQYRICPSPEQTVSPVFLS